MGLFGKKEKNDEEVQLEGKYQEACSLCGKAPTDKKWGGQYFHKKCFRRMKRMSKGMM